MLYLGWIVAAFLAGAITAVIILKSKKSLRKSMSSIDSLAGRKYADIILLLNAAPKNTAKYEGGGTLCTWEELGYSISLLFDQNDICRGVMDESG